MNFHLLQDYLEEPQISTEVIENPIEASSELEPESEWRHQVMSEHLFDQTNFTQSLHQKIFCRDVGVLGPSPSARRQAT